MNDRLGYNMNQRKKKLGISIYPEYASTEDILAYMRKAHELGFSRIFTCLISSDGTIDGIEKQFGVWSRPAYEMGYEIIADVSPDVFKSLNLWIIIKFRDISINIIISMNFHIKVVSIYTPRIKEDKTKILVI